MSTPRITFSRHESAAFTVPAFPASFPNMFTRSTNAASPFDLSTGAGVFGNTMAKNVHSAVVTASFLAAPAICRSRDDIVAAKYAVGVGLRFCSRRTSPMACTTAQRCLCSGCCELRNRDITVVHMSSSSSMAATIAMVIERESLASNPSNPTSVIPGDTPWAQQTLMLYLCVRKQLGQRFEVPQWLHS